MSIISTRIDGLELRLATEADVPAILSFIQQLADYEKLSDQVVATEQKLRDTLFADKAYAEVVLANYQGKDVGFALFFHNYSTFWPNQEFIWKTYLLSLLAVAWVSVKP